MKKIKGITIRKAKIEDVKHILSMGYQFYLESMEGAEEDFDSKHLAELVASIINGDKADMLLVENGVPIGMAAVFEAPAYYNPKVTVCDAHHLYVDAGYRNSSAVKVLISGIKHWAKNRGLCWTLAKISEGKRLNIKRMTGGK